MNNLRGSTWSCMMVWISPHNICVLLVSIIVKTCEVRRHIISWMSPSALLFWYGAVRSPSWSASLTTMALDFSLAPPCGDLWLYEVQLDRRVVHGRRSCLNPTTLLYRGLCQYTAISWDIVYRHWIGFNYIEYWCGGSRTEHGSTLQIHPYTSEHCVNCCPYYRPPVSSPFRQSGVAVCDINYSSFFPT